MNLTDPNIQNDLKKNIYSDAFKMPPFSHSAALEVNILLVSERSY